MSAKVNVPTVFPAGTVILLVAPAKSYASYGLVRFLTCPSVTSVVPSAASAEVHLMSNLNFFSATVGPYSTVMFLVTCGGYFVGVGSYGLVKDALSGLVL